MELLIRTLERVCKNYYYHIRKVIIMSVLKVNKNNFDSVKNSEKPVLLDFYADWCGPCRMVSPLVDQIAEENPQYVVGKINVDQEPELAQTFGVLSIPTLVVLKDGKVASQVTGARPKAQILAMLEG
jgi:thioredoxin 1